MTANQALLDIGLTLKQLNYKFTAITPESHQRVNNRNLDAKSLRDVFGWNRPFSQEAITPALLENLTKTKMLATQGEKFISQIRFASLYEDIYLHSGFPTLQKNAVFFGPDTYRYARFLHQHIEGARRVVDVGCGSGAGGLCLHDRVDQIVLVDINDQALRYARINSTLADVSERVEILHSDVLANVQREIDLVISNPPFLVDDSERAYRHGGELFGAALSVRIVKEGLEKLSAGGKIALYTASAIVDGKDTFWEAVQPLLNKKKHRIFYEEIDPDVFGEELERKVYQNVERLAVVGLVVELL